MPETSVSEDGYFGSGKYKVRAPWQFHAAHMPAPDAELDQVGTYPALSRGIIRGPYSAHIATAGRRRFELIRHNSSIAEDPEGLVYNL